MRIVGGRFKGRSIASPTSRAIRPTADRLREALFNILVHGYGDPVHEARVLDLFAGTGSVGIEALSRGAAYVELVEADRTAAEVIRENLTTTQLGERARVVRGDVYAHLKRAPEIGFDYIHVAPPQYRDLWVTALEALDAQPAWVNPDGWVCAQIDPTEYKPLELKNLTLVSERKYGSTLLVFYERVD